jgi:hypothetical protein
MRNVVFALTVVAASVVLAAEAVGAPASGAPWRLTLRASDFPRGKVGQTQTFLQKRHSRSCGTMNKAFLGARDRRLIVMGASVAYCRSARSAQRWVDSARLYAETRNASLCRRISVRGATVAIDCYDRIGEGHVYLLRRGRHAARLAPDHGLPGSLRHSQARRIVRVQARRLAR